MWDRPWKYKEGLMIGAGLFLTGVFLQIAVGKVDWDVFASPVNVIALGAFVLLIVAAYLLRHKLYIVSYLSSLPCAVCSTAWASFLTVVMGLVRQSPSSSPSMGFPWFEQMLSNWSFVLVYFWMIASLGLSVLRVCIPFKFSKIPFLLNHLGLFIAVTCGVLGSADLMRLKMTSHLGTPEWRALDDMGEVHELPLAVELRSFRIDEYPPKLVFVDNESGEVVTQTDWNVEVLDTLLDSAPVFTEDSVRYNEYHSTGSCASMLVKATRDGSGPVEGWVSCGSYAFPVKALKLDEKLSLAMPEREPQRYVSAVNVYTESGKCLADTIKVNHPCRIEGWKIYQYSYDHNLGKWSEYSVFEIIRDPWLPAVYTGIIMLILGAVCMFVQFGSKKKEDTL